MNPANVREGGVRAWGWRAVAVVLSALLVALVCGVAVAGNTAEETRRRQPELSPDQPMHHFWFRTGRGAPGEAESMDPRLGEMAEAFGRGEFEQARELVEALVDASDDASVRAEAVGFIIESHLAEGDFEGARAAAEHFEDREAVARVSKLKADYLAEVGRLQRIVATTNDPGEAARAQLETARVHKLAGLLNVAQESYWKVISVYTGRTEASWALSEVVEMHRVRDDPKGAVAVCRMAVDLAPDGHLAVRACESIEGLSLAHGEIRYEEAREHLRRIAAEHPGTRAADAARFGMGELYVAEEAPDQAEEEWAGLLAERPESRPATEARVRLADLRYTMGTGAFFEEDYAEAVRWLEPLVPDVDFVGVKTGSGRLLDEADRTVASKRRHAVFSLGEAYQKVGEWGKAADVFAGLAVPGNPAEEVALFELGRSKMEAGDEGGALEAFTRLKERFPESAFLARREGQIRTIEGER